MNATRLSHDETTCWRAVQERDARFDTIFYYGVSSTGVYCRPSCAARAPLRANVTFFTGPADAEHAGFRACRRCRPNATHPHAALAQRACQLIAENTETGANLNVLSAQLGVSPSHLQRTFKRVLGVSPREYAASQRATSFKANIQQGLPVTDALYEAGYGSGSRLYENAPARLGMTPAAYRRQGSGLKINYTVAPCALGQILVAATERGICAVTLGDDAETLRQNLHTEFAQAAITFDETGLNGWLDALLRHLEGRQPQLDVPLDVAATAFQARVWEELRRIPYGQTATYSDIAQRLNQPTATRAVARACATNPAALVTPCHRVIGANGSLSGYRWGIERKAALLAQERKLADA